MKFFLILLVLFIVSSVGGMIFFIVWIIRKSTQKPPAETLQNEKAEMHAKAAAKTGSLVPWDNRKSTDLLLNISFSYATRLKRTFSGHILLADGTGLVYFHRIERGLGSDGHIVAYSTAFNYYFETFSNGAVKIEYNGKPLGSIASNGNILDAANQPIGFAKHPPKVQIEIGNLIRHRTGSNTYPITMNGSQLATIWVAPNFYDFPTEVISSNENFFQGAVIEPEREPTAEEETWLRAIAILEVTFHGFWFV